MVEKTKKRKGYSFDINFQFITENIPLREADPLEYASLTARIVSCLYIYIYIYIQGYS